MFAVDYALLVYKRVSRQLEPAQSMISKDKSLTDVACVSTGRMEYADGVREGFLCKHGADNV